MGKNEEIQVQTDNKYYQQLVQDITNELNNPKIINSVISKLVFFEQLSGLTLPYQDTKGIRDTYRELKERIEDAKNKKNINKVIRIILTSLTNSYIFAVKIQDEETANKIREIFQQYGYDITKFDKILKGANTPSCGELLENISLYIDVRQQNNQEEIVRLITVFQQYGYDITQYDELIESSKEKPKINIINEIYKELQNLAGINEMEWQNNGYFIPTETHRLIRIDVYRHFGFCKEKQSIKSIKSIREMWEELLPAELLPENPNELPNIHPSDLFILEDILYSDNGEEQQIRFTPLMEKIIEKNTGKPSTENPNRKPLSLEEIIDKIIALCKRYKSYQAPDPTIICSKKIGPFQIIPNMGILEMLLVSPYYDTVSEKYQNIIDYILTNCELSEEDEGPSENLTLEEAKPEDVGDKQRKHTLRRFRLSYKFVSKKTEND